MTTTYFGNKLKAALREKETQREWFQTILMQDLRLVQKPVLIAAIHEASVRISKGGENKWRRLRDRAVRALSLRSV